MANLANYYAVINPNFAHNDKLEWIVYRKQPSPIDDEYIGTVYTTKKELFNIDTNGDVELDPKLHTRMVLHALWDNRQKIVNFLGGKKLTDQGLETI